MMFNVPETPVAGPSAMASTCVKVYARSRPLLQGELKQGARSVVDVLTKDNQVLVEDSNDNKSYKFQHVFDEDSTQEEIYNIAVAPLVAKVAKGQKATVFAYGQTGSGKTYSMGTDPCKAKEDEGILQRSMLELLSQEMKDKDLGLDSSCEVSLSFLEVYNEVIFDLLTPSRTALKTISGRGGAVSPVGMIEEKVTSVQEGLKLLERGSHHRTVAATALNQHSSRSHALIYVMVQNGTKEGCLILVDLAGAEGVGRAQTSGQHLAEGIHINRGLLTLGKVLSALSNSSSTYVPYRESILTRLLKESLSGSGHTAMIACVNPANYNLHETLNTLRYAEQAQNIRMKPQVFSTIKRSGVKRRCEDVTATPGAWKRRALTGKKDHNTTVSTPGHKPPAKKALPVLHQSFATPSIKINDIPMSSKMLPVQNELPSCLPFNLGQPIFEDDSPSRLSTVSVIENPEPNPSNFSPYLARMTNRLEQSIMSQFESIEERVADRIISKLKGKKRRSKRKSVKLSATLSSTPTDDGKSTDTSDDSLGSVTLSLLGGSKVLKKLIRGVVDEVQSHQETKVFHAMEKSNFAEETNTKKVLGDASNIMSDRTYSCKNAGVFNKNESMDTRPLTSTTFNDRRHVRKSTRLSTKRSIHSALYEKVSPLYHGSAAKLEDQSLDHNTVLMQQNTASPMLHSRLSAEDTVLYSSVLELPKFDLKGKIPQKPELLQENNRDCLSDSVLQIDRTVLSTNPTRRSSRLSAVKATKRNSEILRACSSVKDTTDMLSDSVLQIDRPFLPKNPSRRSSRLSAIKATQKNYEIFKGCSPASGLCRKKKVNATLNTTKAGSQSVTVVAADDDGDVTRCDQDKSRWKLVITPKQQETYYAEILELLNTGTVRKLQQMPTIGPKTAMILYNYRQMYGAFTKVEDISSIPALPKSFYTRFMKANLMDQISFGF